ncbi:putative ORFan [Tupanvirus deep ocean]|uniref:ORFan n=2 Tax=Tupanvirus TaxID=2094720 RepID=A0AC62A9V4_9VIRU|nr:putative ORFan [Tupanvirus deep ocean]QKU34403.1 putative ORFan [Tupanvirus deep ocean]
MVRVLNLIQETIIIKHTFISIDKKTSHQFTDSEISQIPYLAGHVSFHAKSNSNCNSIKTCITTLGFDCIKHFIEYGEWPVPVMKFGAIIKDMSLTQSLEFLGINDEPHFFLDSITDDLIWLHNNGVQIHLRFDTNDYRKTSFYFHEFDFDFYSHPFCEWSNAELYSISQSYFDAVENATENNEFPEFIQIHLDVSMLHFSVEMMIRKETHSNHHHKYDHCINCEDSYCNICINCEDSYCNICDMNPADCVFCEDCGECRSAACACDRAIDLEMRDREESDEKRDKQKFKQTQKRMKYEANLDDYIERKYDRAQVGIDAD